MFTDMRGVWTEHHSLKDNVHESARFISFPERSLALSLHGAFKSVIYASILHSQLLRNTE